MKAILIRSPYFTVIDETSQLGSKVELFIWNKGETEPTVPTYTLSKKAASASQTKNEYNISNYIKEYIDIIKPTYDYSTIEESTKQWCYVKVKRYTEETINDFVLLNETLYSAFNGYIDYLSGIQISTNNNYNILTNFRINKTYKYYRYGGEKIPFINIFIAEKDDVSYQVKYSDLNGDNEEIFTIVDNPAFDYLFSVPISNVENTIFKDGNIIEILVDGNSVFKVLFIPECENKYTPMLCSFVNEFGGWDFITFFKAKTESWEIKNKEYNLLPNSLEYNPSRGESKFFNYEAKQSIKINTGWVEEYYNDLIKNLLTSETILLDNKPVKLKTMTTDLKTSLQDKMINYTIEFEYNYNQINNVI